MTPQESERYQAGRCDAHGNRVIAKDEWYLRGWFVALFPNLDGVNPYEPATYKSQCALGRINYNRVVVNIERQIRSFLKQEHEYDMIDAYERGKEAAL